MMVGLVLTNFGNIVGEFAGSRAVLNCLVFQIHSVPVGASSPG